MSTHCLFTGYATLLCGLQGAMYFLGFVVKTNMYFQSSLLVVADMRLTIIIRTTRARPTVTWALVGEVSVGLPMRAPDIPNK